MTQQDPYYACRMVGWDCRQTIMRQARAYAYGIGTLTEDEAGTVLHDCYPVAGYWPLETLSVENVLTTALVHWKDHPALESLAFAACDRVQQKWSSTGNAADAAEDWALDLIGEYAEQDGVELLHLDDDELAAS